MQRSHHKVNIQKLTKVYKRDGEENILKWDRVRGRQTQVYSLYTCLSPGIISDHIKQVRMCEIWGGRNATQFRSENTNETTIY
jgi:hypothetical protein